MTEEARIPYRAPPHPLNQRGEARRVGVEIELGNLSLEASLAVLHEVLGGEVVAQTPTVAKLQTSLGVFKVELDSPSLKDCVYLRTLERLGLDASSETAHLFEESVVRLARTLVPVEVVTPPIPWWRLHELDHLVDALGRAGAQGTSSSVWNAFGLHLNPEPPDSTVGTLLAHLQSFLLLEDWIVVTAEIDISRRLMPYINPFPEAYRRLVLALDYEPSFETFVDDYVEHNPTRNRPLDLLPLMVHLGAEGLEEQVENWPLVKGRPTFHYRLPDSRVGEPGWSVASDWNRWVLVERLADSAELLRELRVAYLRTEDLPLRWQSWKWVSYLVDRLSTFLGDADPSRT